MKISFANCLSVYLYLLYFLPLRNTSPVNSLPTHTQHVTVDFFDNAYIINQIYVVICTVMSLLLTFSLFFGSLWESWRLYCWFACTNETCLFILACSVQDFWVEIMACGFYKALFIVYLRPNCLLP